MNMYTLLLLAGCVAVSMAAQCCVPPQWTSQGSFLTAIVRDGKPYYSRGSLGIAFDAVRKRIGQLENIEINGKTSLNIGVLLDFMANTKWVVNAQTGDCYKMALNRDTEDFMGCVSENATLVGNQDVVGFGNNDMSLNTYMMDYGNVRVYTSLTSDSCVPVVDTIRGELDGNNFIQNMHYFNVSAGLPTEDPLVVPPHGCERAVNFMPSFNYQMSGGLIGKRSVFN
ncbi:hypothetical protein MAR_029432 [Mya arenaria]|uniref:Uncharacterized protein n=1 Tax=Mya arenaria TaxID=6604 RepID=A0ABY7DGF1_MYAAR|nr:uncharacterized protein LOC128245363 isoform X2 [Mya arenaria]WAQ96742.1 hypothetical protein MAR_029432 [Mya arenaria]